ncbi:MAG: DNA polymerase III subunit delta' [Chloroflexi bacterium]|nr:DNA polymerase III subunit delta' [Chloroflexota bacterium]
MNNWEIFGHDWAVEMLQQQVVNANLRHAYLLTGSAGVGRRTLAIRLAQALICTNPLAPGVPCRTCRTCKQIDSGQHPDLLVIKKQTDKKDLIVEQVREVSKFLSLKPYMAAYKIVLITNFEDANASAQNALLKTLEEAPDFAILLLTAENGEQLLPTIVSRCEVVRLRPLKVDLVSDFLVSRGIAGPAASLYAHLADGRPGYALHLSTDTHSLSFRTEKLDDLNKLLAARLRDRIQYAEKLVKDKDVFRKTLFIWLSYWRDVLMKTSGATAPLTNIDRADDIETLSYKLDINTARIITVAVEKAIDMLDRNVNPRLLAEVTLMDWPRVK